MSYNYKHAHSIEGAFHFWQPRFWDHVIRDEVDLERHFDYIHWNPVKHGFVQNPEDWQESSYRHWAKQGVYPAGWGSTAEPAHLRDLTAE